MHVEGWNKEPAAVRGSVNATYGGGNAEVCVQIALNYVCFKGFFKSGDLGVVLLGKLANLLCLDIKKILHMESITFYCKQ